MTNEGVIYDGVKAFSLRELSDRGWTIEGESESDILQLVHDAAWLYAVIEKRAGGAVSIPRVLMTEGGVEVEEDDLPFEFDIPDLMRRSSVAVDVYAKAYGLTVKNQFKDLRVRWFYPDSVTPIIDEKMGLQRFERQAGTVKYIYSYDPKTDTSPDGLWWIWQTGMPEVGPGIPKADVAAGPAMLLRAIDSLGIKYFSQGAIGQVYFTSPQPMGKSDLSKFRQWWNKIWGRGLDTAYNTAVILETGFEPHKLSADPKDLMMTELDQDNRRDICAVYDTPEPLVTGEAGGLSRATMLTLTSNWINGTIMTQAQLIVDAFNHHILEPAGYKLTLNPQGMAVNQEEERQRALAFSMYINAGMDPETAAYFLGLEVPEGFELMAEKDDMILIPSGGAAPTGGSEDMPDDEPEDDEDDDEKSVELAKLRRYIRNGKHLKRDFHSDVLTPFEIAEVEYATSVGKPGLTDEEKRQALREVGQAEDAPFRGTKQGAIQLGDETIDPELRRYYEFIEELAGRARRRDISESEFRRRLKEATLAAILLAFALGGGSEDIEGATERLAEQRRIADESADQLANDIYGGEFDEQDATGEQTARTEEQGRDKLFARVGLWAVTMAGVYSMSQVHTPPTVTEDDGVELVEEPRFVWRLGNTVQHCTDCLDLDGRVHTAAEWRAAAIEPQSPDLECGGWNCDCQFIRTEAESVGALV